MYFRPFIGVVNGQSTTLISREGYVSSVHDLFHYFQKPFPAGSEHERFPCSIEQASSLHGPTGRSTMHPHAISTFYRQLQHQTRGLHFRARGNAAAATRR